LITRNLNITFGIILVVSLFYFVMLTSTTLTWLNVDSDAPQYIIAAEELRISHPSPGSPLYNLINAGWIRIYPTGTTFFKIALLSAFSASLVSVTLYLMTKRVLPSLLWMASGVVVSQSTIVESYALICLVSVIGYWLYREDRRSLAYILLSFGMMIHHLAGIPIVIFMIRDLWLGRDKLPLLWAFVALPMLAYIPLANREPYIWIGGTSIDDYYRYLFSQGGLTGGLAIFPPQDLVRRLGDFALVVGGSLGIAVPLIWLSIKQNKDWLLVSLIAAPLGYYLTNLAPQVYTYSILAVPFTALLISKTEWLIVRPAVTGVLAILVVLNTFWYYNAPYNSAVKFYQELDTLPTESMIWSQNRGWEKMTIELYNTREGTSIDTVDIRKPERSAEVLSIDLLKASEGGKLYRTEIVNPKTYEVKLTTTTPEEVLRDMKKYVGPTQ